ncbi:hypothetical protein M758_12G018000 [Ceratodon purpureus]|uniref:CHCH domain-containing protein n=1 Tax=Ceratodon purpureus TaxID=3225 RepID=A0A8T0G511_CERPU|nr:hypothetical protein KC19_12G018600 [Ceratodon purpureus]KAG0553538.1 hypothetical protein KC19_12G018600 [Ceratodon purpureus]KAG0597740.1 hypothetical protein M758_12G018000 [Ceratodon purpureus]
MAQAFGGNRGLQPNPPEKGVFPLDHLQECKQAMREYMQCLKESKYSSERCRQLSKAYLECRMDRNLMVKQDLNELGFKEPSNDSPKPVEAVTGPTSS